MQPAITTVLKTEKISKPESIDIFACGSTLGNLLRFARQQDLKPFRMIVEVIDNTVFLIRRENSPREKIQGVRGYGHTMPEAYTTWKKEVKGSISPQRIVQYEFAGLQCLVRFESDGYLPSLAPGLSIKAPSDDPTDSGDEEDDGVQIDSLAKALDASMPKSDVPKRDGALKVKTGGGVVSHHPS